MFIIYGYFERDNYKVFKFHMSNSSFFEVSASLFWARRTNKGRPLKIWH